MGGRSGQAEARECGVSMMFEETDKGVEVAVEAAQKRAYKWWWWRKEDPGGARTSPTSLGRGHTETGVEVAVEAVQKRA